jgi:hypothetical protein
VALLAVLSVTESRHRYPGDWTRRADVRDRGGRLGTLGALSVTSCSSPSSFPGALPLTGGADHVLPPRERSTLDVKEASVVRPVIYLLLAVQAVVARAAALLRLRPGDGGAVAGEVAFWWTVVTMTFAFVFGGGRALTDPGGWGAVALIAAWAVPLAASAAVAHLRPGVAGRVLAIALLVPLGYMVWGVIDVERWRDLHDIVGPVPAYLVMVLGTALAVLCRHRDHATTAGLLMVGLVAVAPIMTLTGPRPWSGLTFDRGRLGTDPPRRAAVRLGGPPRPLGRRPRPAARSSGGPGAREDGGPWNACAGTRIMRARRPR